MMTEMPQQNMKCPDCLAPSWKNGLNERSYQIYKCTSCGKQFTLRSQSKFARTRYPSKVIIFAVKLHKKHNLSSYVIADLLATKGVKVSHVSVHKWIRKYGAS